MAQLDSLKNFALFLQLSSSIAKTSLEFMKYAYNFFLGEDEPDKSSEKKESEQIISSSMTSTQIIEEISVFKDENGELKTTISRQVLKKVVNPDHMNLQASNDNADPTQNISEQLKEVANTICGGENQDKAYCRQLAGIIENSADIANDNAA